MIFTIDGGSTHIYGYPVLVNISGIPAVPAGAVNFVVMARFTNMDTLDEWILSLDAPFPGNTANMLYDPESGSYDLKIEIGFSYNDSNNGMALVEEWEAESQTIQMLDASEVVPGGATQLSGNPIQIFVSTTPEAMAGKSRYKLALKITCDELMGSPYVEEIAPDANLSAKFEISGFVDQPLDIEFQNPPLDKIIAHPILARTITLDSGEVYIDENDDRQVAWNGTLSGAQIRVIKGDLHEYELGLLNEDGKTFNSEYIEGGKFLTHIPQNQKVSPRQIVKLWFMDPGKDNHHVVTLNFEAEITSDNGPYSYTEDFVITPNSGLIEFNINPAMYGFIPQVLQLPANIQVTAYTFWLSDQTGDISERRRFVVDNTPYDREFFFYSRNRFSAVDSIWLHGQYSEKLKTESETAYRQVPVGSGTKVASLATISSSGQRFWELNTGWKNPDELRALRDFLESKERWMIDSQQVGPNGENWWRLIPVVIESGEFEVDNSREDFIPNMEIKMLEAHK